MIGRAARKIQRETQGAVRSDLLFILQALSGRRYTAKELAGAIPKEMVMASSLWAEAAREGREEGRKRGREEGRIEAARELCLDLTRQHHSDVAERIVPIIEACPDVERLRDWALRAPQLSDSAFWKLVSEQAGPTSGPTGRGRTPRPSRKA